VDETSAQGDASVAAHVLQPDRYNLVMQDVSRGVPVLDDGRHLECAKSTGGDEEVATAG
jgi:hypothetical protein